MSSALPERHEPSTATGTISIGQVLSRLETDFPELSPSKLRFLEDRGLIHPARTASGYRSFSPSDIDRIKLVLQMQRDHYLPLKVIRRYLADLDAGRNPEWPGTATGAISILGTERRWTRDELLAEAGAGLDLLGDAIATGLMQAAEVYDEGDVATMKALADLRSAGIEPRHLRAMRIAVERELELVANALLPLRRRADSASRQHADERANELAGDLETVRSALVKRALDKHAS
ncbi:transcriptional regulator FtsR [Amnibacterium setariae]|uniref:MerR family transcriptional regulator n=1 Tax=Amnibacterium setariae TaxID=2306585 RepID=A0A3A1TUZ7_9MICO|nr:MerR family transcriptional regulator [Amnibacterium setariae]RIX27640.1 MerR family transcriptional regulator [Amnibacterium setariae]